MQFNVNVMHLSCMKMNFFKHLSKVHLENTDQRQILLVNSVLISLSFSCEWTHQIVSLVLIFYYFNICLIKWILWSIFIGLTRKLQNSCQETMETQRDGNVFLLYLCSLHLIIWDPVSKEQVVQGIIMLCKMKNGGRYS